MRLLHDDCGRPVPLPLRPQRVVCLCPSLTETLAVLGLGERLVGRTRYCIHPATLLETVAECGGTKQLQFERLKALAPDLIIAEKEENRREDVERLAERYPVYVLDVRDLGGALAAISRLGDLVGLAAAASRMRREIETAWQALPALQARRRVLYLIWRKPWMVAGAGTYIDAVLERLGLDNPARALDGRYPCLDEADLRAMEVDLCLLSSEPYPFGAEHLDELQARLPGAAVECVDGEMFSWYGARMAPAADYLASRLARWDERLSR